MWLLQASNNAATVVPLLLERGADIYAVDDEGIRHYRSRISCVRKKLLLLTFFPASRLHSTAPCSV